MRRRSGFAGAAALLLAACGYHPLYGGEGAAPLHVRLVRAPVADAVAADEVVSGVREALAREGALAGGDGYPRVEVEVIRLDEVSDAVAAEPAPSGLGGSVPRARASDVGVVARAWVVASPGAEPLRDTGDMRAFDVVRPATSAAGDAFRHDDAVRATGRRLGEHLAFRILGHPTADDERPSAAGGRR